MKVLLSLLSTVAITSSSAAFASSNVFVGQKETTEKQKLMMQSDEQIDWNMTAKSINDYFNDLKNQQSLSNQQLFATSDSVDTVKMINFAQEKALEYTKQFANLNLSLEEMIDKISTKFPDFKKNYNEAKINPPANNDIINFGINSLREKSNQITTLTNDPTASVKKVVENLKIAKYSLATAVAAAAGAAAGFWAAAWWFGISIPWAVACSTIAAVVGVGLAGVNLALVKYDSEISDLMKGYLSVSATVQLGMSMYSILAPALYTASSITFLAWALPAVTAVAAFISAFLITLEFMNK